MKASNAWVIATRLRPGDKVSATFSIFASTPKDWVGTHDCRFKCQWGSLATQSYEMGELPINGLRPTVYKVWPREARLPLQDRRRGRGKRVGRGSCPGVGRTLPKVRRGEGARRGPVCGPALTPYPRIASRAVSCKHFPSPNMLVDSQPHRDAGGTLLPSAHTAGFPGGPQCNAGHWPNRPSDHGGARPETFSLCCSLVLLRQAPAGLGHCGRRGRPAPLLKRPVGDMQLMREAISRRSEESGQVKTFFVLVKNRELLLKDRLRDRAERSGDTPRAMRHQVPARASRAGLPVPPAGTRCDSRSGPSARTRPITRSVGCDS